MTGNDKKGQTLFWYDFETTGADPVTDRPVQFAGLRTDASFTVLEEPVVFYCKPALDLLPHPEACLLTGITPQQAEQNGVCEAEFARLIHEQFARPGTCALGYNSLRFDDEVTRNCLYRNFYDPYAREWRNGNSRWDMIDVVRAARALRPEGLTWPNTEDGRPDFKLAALTKVNGVSHFAAHDALSDVHATVALAELLRLAQPKLYAFLWRHRGKEPAFDLLRLGSYEPLVHVSGKYPARNLCLAIVLPICRHPNNPNGVIVYDLSVDPEALLTLTAAEIKQRVFTASDQLPDGIERIPLKIVHVNKCPVLAPLSVIRSQDVERLQLNMNLIRAHGQKIKSAAAGLADKLAEVFQQPAAEALNPDPDFSLYSGGFFSDSDKQKMNLIRAAKAEKLAAQAFNFSDARLPEMLFRYRARNYSETLSADETEKWRKFCVDRFLGLKPGAGITLPRYFESIEYLRQQAPEKSEILHALESYAFDKMKQLGIAEEIVGRRLSMDQAAKIVL